jgi:hypothetical protein
MLALCERELGRILVQVQRVQATFLHASLALLLCTSLLKRRRGKNKTPPPCQHAGVWCIGPVAAVNPSGPFTTRQVP